VARLVQIDDVAERSIRELARARDLLIDCRAGSGRAVWSSMTRACFLAPAIAAIAFVGLVSGIAPRSVDAASCVRIRVAGSMHRETTTTCRTSTARTSRSTTIVRRPNTPPAGMSTTTAPSTGTRSRAASSGRSRDGHARQAHGHPQLNAALLALDVRSRLEQHATRARLPSKQRRYPRQQLVPVLIENRWFRAECLTNLWFRGTTSRIPSRRPRRQH
jgi:hypothetical protein